MTRIKLKELREQTGLSQYELAPLLNLGRATYANYEIGKTQPTIETLCKIADYFGVSLDYLCGHETKGITNIGCLNKKQKQLVNIIKNLNDENTIKVFGYCEGILTKQ